MGKLEEESKKKTRRSATKEAIIATLALSGIITIAVVAPKCLSLLKTTATGRKLSNKLFYTKSAFWELVDEGYIEVDPKTKKNARLTERGRRKYELTKIPDKPRKWDQKWRMFIFDIKEKRRFTRDTIRDILGRFGFLRLQNSVWIYPYPCEEFVSLLKVDQKIGKDVLYVIADQIENDKWLRAHFSLPQRQ